MRDLVSEPLTLEATANFEKVGVRERVRVRVLVCLLVIQLEIPNFQDFRNRP
jgi:hypothetical protein